MKDPVSGVFRVADWYNKHPHSSPPGRTLTGVIVADGIPPTPAEAPADHHGKWVSQKELPITVDRANPADFRIEWDQVVQNDWREVARQRAQEAASKMVTGDQQATPFAAPFVTPTETSFQAGSGFTPVTGAGLPAMMEQAFRAAGIDPTALNSSNVYIQTSGTSQFAHAEPATGVVRAVHDVVAPMPVPAGISQADLTLDVTRSDGSTYPVTTRIGFSTPQRRAAIAAVGVRLPLLVDPTNPGRVSIDVGKLDLP